MCRRLIGGNAHEDTGGGERLGNAGLRPVTWEREGGGLSRRASGHSTVLKGSQPHGQSRSRHAEMALLRGPSHPINSINKPGLGTSRGGSKVQQLQAVNPPRSPLQGLLKGDGIRAPLQLPTLLLTHKPHGKDQEKPLELPQEKKELPAWKYSQRSLLGSSREAFFPENTCPKPGLPA